MSDYNTSINCILCFDPWPTLYLKKTGKNLNGREYYLCQTCDLVFVPKHHHLDLQQQKTFYDHHQNHEKDPGYITHLQKLTKPLANLLPKHAHGLDYGSGPGPSLKTAFERPDLHIHNYDPIYAPDTSILQQRFDFVTATEVAEHFGSPSQDWLTLKSLLLPQGLLGIMTQFRVEDKKFAEWWYHRDATHVVFYSEKTFLWLAKFLGMPLVHCQNPIVIFKSH